MVDMIINALGSYGINITPELVYLGMAALVYVLQFVVHFIDNYYSGAAKTVTGKIIMFIVRKIISRIEPGKLGRKLAAKKNPNSVNAARADDNYINLDGIV